MTEDSYGSQANVLKTAKLKNCQTQQILHEIIMYLAHHQNSLKDSEKDIWIIKLLINVHFYLFKCYCYSASFVIFN